MWRVQSIQARPVELDFTSSGQGRRRATAIDSDKTRLVNAVELVEFSLDLTQVEVCAQCGCTRCSSGGWVAMRRVDDSVVWLPAWSEMECGEREGEEYRPPDYLTHRGAPLFAEEVWSELRGLHHGVPLASALLPLEARDVARVVQWSAPGRVLGGFPAPPKLRRDVLVAVSTGALQAEADAVDHGLNLLFASPNAMQVVVGVDDLVPIEFYLDLPGTPAWAPLSRFRDGLCLPIGGGLALVPEAG